MRWLGLAALVIQVIPAITLEKVALEIGSVSLPSLSTMKTYLPDLEVNPRALLQVVSILLAYALSSGQQKLLEHARYALHH